MHHHSTALCGQLLMAMAYNTVFHFKAVIFCFRHARAHRNGVRIGQRQTEAALHGPQNGTNAGGVAQIIQIDALKIGYARAFKIAKIDRIVDMTIGIHIAPEYGQLDDNRIGGEELGHVFSKSVFSRGVEERGK